MEDAAVVGAVLGIVGIFLLPILSTWNKKNRTYRKKISMDYSI